MSHASCRLGTGLSPTCFLILYLIPPLPSPLLLYNVPHPYPAHYVALSTPRVIPYLTPTNEHCRGPTGAPVPPERGPAFYGTRTTRRLPPLTHSRTPLPLGLSLTSPPRLSLPPGASAEVVAHLGLGQFAARIRATDQLTRLYSAWRAAEEGSEEGAAAALGPPLGTPALGSGSGSGSGGGSGSCVEAGSAATATALVETVMDAVRRHCRS